MFEKAWQLVFKRLFAAAVPAASTSFVHPPELNISLTSQDGWKLCKLKAELHFLNAINSNTWLCCNDSLPCHVYFSSNRLLFRKGLCLPCSAWRVHVDVCQKYSDPLKSIWILTNLNLVVVSNTFLVLLWKSSTLTTVFSRLKNHFGNGLLDCSPRFETQLDNSFEVGFAKTNPLFRGAVCAAAATGTAAIAKDGELFAWGYGQAPDGCML